MNVSILQVSLTAPCFLDALQGKLDGGISQYSAKSLNSDDPNYVVWNFPIDITFKATNPYGWPQLVRGAFDLSVCEDQGMRTRREQVISVYGDDAFGNAILRGYGCIHMPTTPGRLVLIHCQPMMGNGIDPDRHELTIRTYAPQASSLLQRFVNFLSGAR